MADICSAQLPINGQFGPAVRFAAQVTVTPAAVAATTVASQTGTVLGARTDMLLVIRSIAPATNASVVKARCSANDVVQFDYINPTDASVTPTSGSMLIIGL